MQESIVKHRRGTTAEWQQFDLVIKDGEIVIEECDDGSRILKIGDGIHKYSELPSFTDKIVVTDLIINKGTNKFKIIVNDNGNISTERLQ